jgi:NodT family efflux transporter outer membrane factor (OMF) lipoprotein
MKTTSLLVLALSAFLTGCTTLGPDYQAPAVRVPVSFRPVDGSNDASAKALLTLRDPVLDKLLARLRLNNHDLAIAALRYAHSKANYRSTAAQQGPQVNAVASAARRAQSETGAATRMAAAMPGASRAALLDILSEPHDAFQGGLDISWELDLWGRVRRSIETADANTREAAALMDGVRLSMSAELARSYVELRGLQQQRRLAQTDAATVADLATLQQARVRAGYGNATDQLKRAAQLAESRARLARVQEQEAVATNRIALLVGELPNALHDELVPVSMPLALPDLATGIPSELLARRPDLAAAEARLRAATARIGVAKAELYPRITLGAALGFESVNAAQALEWGSRQWSIGPGLHLPLFDRGRRSAIVELRELEQQEAAVAYQRAVLQAWHEVDNALSLYAAERKRLAELQVQEAAARSIVTLAEARRKAGNSDDAPLLEARRSLLQAETEASRTASALRLAALAVGRAVGLAP